MNRTFPESLVPADPSALGVTSGAFGRGWVSLVGAGPGDPDLITVRGRDRLAAAEIVIYDDLAGSALLKFCAPGCVTIYVGKRAGHHHVTQETTNQLLVAQARLGRRVVRLKGGDPFVFGRGGEEIESLARAGIPCEVVPGVTAATAAAAATGIPLTHREFASGVLFLTGHECDGKKHPAIDWSLVARLRTTLCLYMGARLLPVIASRLRDGGLDAGTPVAVISRVSRPDQSTATWSLGEVAGGTTPAAESPALIIIGAVAAFPEKIAALSAEASSLAGGS